MGMLADVIHEVCEINPILGGSGKTQSNRRINVTGFLFFAREIGALSRTLAEVRPWQVQMYAAHCIAKGKSASNMANIFSSIRVTCAAAGNDLSASCSNLKLGLPRRSRKGARRAQSDAEINALLERARQIDEGLWHLIRLARLLGLRRLEAIMCARDLQMWLDALIAGETVLHVIRGAKNLRPREVEVLEKYRHETIEAVREALAFIKQRNNYQFITGRGRTLSSALNRFKALARQAGMTGEVSFHSLRYTYALALANQLLDGGVSPYETLVRLSGAMGHGPSRVVLMKTVYLQPLAHRFKGCRTPRRSEAHLRSPAKPLPRAQARREAKEHHARISGFPVGRMEAPANPFSTAERSAGKPTGRPATASKARAVRRGAGGRRTGRTAARLRANPTSPFSN
jgi:integrase